MPKKSQTHASKKDVAEAIESVHQEVLNTQDMIQETESQLERKIGGLATKNDLATSEDRLLNAIRGIEVRKEDLEALKSDVHELTERVTRLERK